MVMVDNYLVPSHHRFMEDTFLPGHIKYVSEGTRYNMLSTGWNTNRTRVETISFVFRNKQNFTFDITRRD